MVIIQGPAIRPVQAVHPQQPVPAHAAITVLVGTMAVVAVMAVAPITAAAAAMAAVPILVHAAHPVHHVHVQLSPRHVIHHVPVSKTAAAHHPAQKTVHTIAHRPSATRHLQHILEPVLTPTLVMAIIPVRAVHPQAHHAQVVPVGHAPQQAVVAAVHAH